MVEEIFIPKFGQTVEEVTLVNFLVKDGVKINPGEPLLEVETDKAVFTVEATSAGYVHWGDFTTGQVVPVLSVVGIIGAQQDTFKLSVNKVETPKTEVIALTEPTAAVAERQVDVSIPSGGGKRFISPRARRLAQEHGIDPAALTPSGNHGTRVVSADVFKALASQPKVSPLARRVAEKEGIDLSSIQKPEGARQICRDDVERALLNQDGLVDAEVAQRIPLKGIRGIIAQRMAASTHTTSRVTLFMDVDVTKLVELRESLKQNSAKAGKKAPSYNELFVKVCASALRAFPYMNSRITDTNIEILAHVNIGIAVDTERGLIVPVIHDADTLTLSQIQQAFENKITAARANQLTPEDLSGGTFTITNLGTYDVDGFTPVINLPEAAILGLGRIADKVMALDGKIEIRKMMTLSLVFDHRLVDGAPAARFLQYIKNLIQQPPPELLAY